MAPGALSSHRTLLHAKLPAHLDTVAASTFSSCRYLTSVEIPKTVTEVEEGAFGLCSRLELVFFGGTEAEWQAVSVKVGNEPLTGAKICYYSERQPIEAGNYWHYVDGIPTLWES